jgi:hypothetical protein
MTSAPRDDEIAEYLNANPPQYYPTMNILGHEVRPIASQPITSFASHPSFKLADFGHGNCAASTMSCSRSDSSVISQLSGTATKSLMTSAPQRYALQKPFYITIGTKKLTSGRLDVWFVELANFLNWTHLTADIRKSDWCLVV